MNEQWKNKIEEATKSNEIMVYIRGTPDAPRCGFTARVIKVLQELNRPFGHENMDSDPELWSTLKEINNWPTSPQIYVKGEFVGGCDIFVEMYRSGELHTMLGIQK
jgi:monothiol glutaredoxin